VGHTNQGSSKREGAHTCSDNDNDGSGRARVPEVAMAAAAEEAAVLQLQQQREQQLQSSRDRWWESAVCAASGRVHVREVATGEEAAAGAGLYIPKVSRRSMHVS
jgi:hypothetical protein